MGATKRRSRTASQNRQCVVSAVFQKLAEWFKAGWRIVGSWLRAVINLAVCTFFRPMLLIAMAAIAPALVAGAITAIVVCWEELLFFLMDKLKQLICLLKICISKTNAKGCPENGQDSDLAVLAVTYLGALGVAGALWNYARGQLWEALRTVAAALKDALMYDWFPKRPGDALVSEVINAHVKPVLKCVARASRSWLRLGNPSGGSCIHCLGQVQWQL